MTKSSKYLYAAILLNFLVPIAIFNSHGIVSPAAVYAEEPWKEKLMELCAKTDVAMTLSTQELKELIAGCERLSPVIESLEESPRKVYRKRLKMCRDLFTYVLETKEQAAVK